MDGKGIPRRPLQLLIQFIGQAVDYAKKLVRKLTICSQGDWITVGAGSSGTETVIGIVCT